MIALFERGAVGREDNTDAATFHFAANRHGSGIGFRVIHATAHIGVQRHVADCDQNLAVAGAWHIGILKPEVTEGR